MWCHQSFANQSHLHFALLADFEPKGAVARAYGAYRQPDGVYERALLVIDAKGVIFWSYCSPMAINPALTAFSTPWNGYRNKRLQWSRGNTARESALNARLF